YVSADGVVTVVGYNDMREMLEPMAARFAATHPGIRIRLDLPGTRFAPAALAKGDSAFAPMGAEFTPPQLADYRAIRGDDPVAFKDAAMGMRAFAADLKGLPQSAEVVQRISQDPDGIGFAAAMRASGAARVLPLAARDDDEPVAPTEESIVAGRYPLDRFLLIYATRPVTPLVREFLRLVLSREGQAAVAATPQRYIPLSAKDAAAELGRAAAMKEDS